MKNAIFVFVFQAGLIVSPKSTKPMTSQLNLTNAVTTSENAFLHQNGHVMDYRMHQAKDLNRIQTSRQDNPVPP